MNKFLAKVAVGLVLMGLIVIPVYSSTLEEEVQKLKAAGIPTTIEELNLPEIPDEENGALVYKKAFDLMDSLKKEHKDVMDYLPYESTYKWEDVPKENKNKMINFVFNNPEFSEMYQLVEKASQMKCTFLNKEDYQTPHKRIFPHLQKLRSCARIVAAKAKIEKERWETDKALGTCLTSLRIGNSFSNEPTLISQLVRIAIDGIALNNLEEVMSGELIEEKSTTNLYQSIIKEIGQKRNDNLTLYALGGDVMNLKQNFSYLRETGDESFRDALLYASGEENKGMLTRAYQQNPGNFLNEQEITYFQTILKIAPLIKEPYWKTKDKFEELSNETQKLPIEKAFFASSLVPIFNRTLIGELRNDALLGTAEITIANKIYETKHSEYVDSLSQLSPEILSSIPLDPFTGKDYIYRKKDKGFIVYSVGDNLKDDNGISQKETGWKGDYDIVWECSF